MKKLKFCKIFLAIAVILNFACAHRSIPPSETGAVSAGNPERASNSNSNAAVESAGMKAQKLSLSSLVFDGSQIPFISHRGEGAFANYVVMSLPAEPAQKAFFQLTQIVGPLLTRGESHLTVISPPEFHDILSRHLSIEAIEHIAQQGSIQLSQITPLCVGEGKASVEGKLERTYFIVVRSENILDIRRAIARAFIKAGGSANAFRPEHFFPHITLGFSKSDLYEEQGVIKDQSACLSYVQLEIEKAQKP